MSERPELTTFTDAPSRTDPNEWEERTVSDVISINDYPSLEKGVEQTHVGMKQIEENVRNVQDTVQKEYNYSKPRFKNGDTLFARITPCLENGKTAFVDILDDGEVATGSTEFFVLSATDETIPKFVYYTARRPDVRQFAIKRMTGSSGRQRVPTDVFDDLTIAVPPIEEQKRIVGFLDALDSKIETNRSLVRLLNEFALTYLRDKFEIPSTVDEDGAYDGTVGKLGDFVEITMGYSPKSEYYNERGEGLPFFQGSKNFGERYPEVETWCTQPNKVAEPGDVLLSVRAPVGDVNIAKEQCIIGRGVAALSLKGEYDHNEFLFQFLRANEHRWEMYESGTTFNSITRADIADLPVVKPLKENLDDYTEKMLGLPEYCRSVTNENRTLEETRDSMLPKLLTGEIRLAR